MELVYAGNLPDAETLRRVLREQGIHAHLLAVMFTRVEGAAEARRVAGSMENGGAA